MAACTPLLTGYLPALPQPTVYSASLSTWGTNTFPALKCTAESGGDSGDAQGLAASFRSPQVVLDLLVQPALGRRIERDREPHCHLGTDTGPAIQHRRERLPADTE